MSETYFIKFNFDNAYSCEGKLRQTAELIGQEAVKIKSIIGAVETGWTGAGSAEYIQYLQMLDKNMQERAQSLNEIADIIKGAAIAAADADRRAREEFERNSSNVTMQVCPPPQQSSPPQTPQTSQNQGAARPSHSYSAPDIGSAAQAEKKIPSFLGTAFDAINNVKKNNG